MFTLFWKWAVSFFTADRIGVLVRKLFISAAKPVVSDLLNPQNQKKAYEFVKQLHARKDLTNTQKAGEFNKMFIAWAKKQKVAIRLSIVNCLRELAVNALKAESPVKQDQPEQKPVKAKRKTR